MIIFVDVFYSDLLIRKTIEQCWIYNVFLKFKLYSELKKFEICNEHLKIEA